MLKSQQLQVIRSRLERGTKESDIKAIWSFWGSHNEGDEQRKAQPQIPREGQHGRATFLLELSWFTSAALAQLCAPANKGMHIWWQISSFVMFSGGELKAPLPWTSYILATWFKNKECFRISVQTFGVRNYSHGTKASTCLWRSLLTFMHQPISNLLTKFGSPNHVHTRRLLDAIANIRVGKVYKRGPRGNERITKSPLATTNENMGLDKMIGGC